ncbi:MAG: LacI family DNA-binding transcriptional regulator [Verrucomicrobiae bacterium]|nr:LacI family DNA-binding transcriptional regulator [Verrucomicrobiae bacterium]
MADTKILSNEKEGVRRRVSLKDLARQAGCSITLVSSVVNGAKGNAYVSQAMRKKILDLAARCQYRPHFASRMLRSRGPHTIGVYLQSKTFLQLGNPRYVAPLLRGISEICAKCHCDLLMCNLDGGESFSSVLQKVQESRISGLIIIHPALEDEGDDKLRKDEIDHEAERIIVIGHHRLNERIETIQFDNRAAARAAVEYLAGLGHRTIGFLGTPLDRKYQDTNEREEGFREAVRQFGLSQRRELVFNAETNAKPVQSLSWSEMTGHSGVDQLLGLGEGKPTAMIAYNELVAAAACQRLHMLGVKIPGEMSVIGIDDSDLSLLLWPPLTSVRQPLVAMGREAARRLLLKQGVDIAEGGPVHAPVSEGVVRFAPELIERKSTGPFLEK